MYIKVSALVIFIFSSFFLLAQKEERYYYTDLDEALANKSKVKQLDLFGKNLKNVDEIYEFDNLERLLIEECTIDSITDDIRK